LYPEEEVYQAPGNVSSFSAVRWKSRQTGRAHVAWLQAGDGMQWALRSMERGGHSPRGFVAAGVVLLVIGGPRRQFSIEGIEQAGFR
jgi:hypothetical protein